MSFDTHAPAAKAAPIPRIVANPSEGSNLKSVFAIHKTKTNKEIQKTSLRRSLCRKKKLERDLSNNPTMDSNDYQKDEKTRKIHKSFRRVLIILFSPCGFIER